MKNQFEPGPVDYYRFVNKAVTDTPDEAFHHIYSRRMARPYDCQIAWECR